MHKLEYAIFAISIFSDYLVPRENCWKKRAVPINTQLIIIIKKSDNTFIDSTIPPNNLNKRSFILI